MKKLLLLGAAVIAMQALPVLAAETATTTKAPVAKEDGMKPHGGGMFEKQDTDKDGTISESEFLSHAKERFNEMDANKDGKITKEEGKAHHEAMKGKWKEKREEMKARKGGDATPPEAPAGE